MYPKDKNHFSVKNIFPKNSNKKAFHVKQTNFEKKMWENDQRNWAF